MAYDVSKEKKKNIIEIEENDHGDYVRVDKVEKPNGGIVFDIRRWYTDSEDEVKPTSKGIRVRDDCVGDVVWALVAGTTSDEPFKNAVKALLSLGRTHEEIADLVCEAVGEAEEEEPDDEDEDGDMEGIEDDQ